MESLHEDTAAPGSAHRKGGDSNSHSNSHSRNHNGNRSTGSRMSSSSSSLSPDSPDQVHPADRRGADHLPHHQADHLIDSEESEESIGEMDQDLYQEVDANHESIYEPLKTSASASSASASAGSGSGSGCGSGSGFGFGSGPPQIRIDRKLFQGEIFGFLPNSLTLPPFFGNRVMWLHASSSQSEFSF